MNTQIQDFITANETKILNKTGKAIADRALVIFDESIKKDTERIEEWRSNDYTVPEDQVMLDPAFYTTVRRMIRGEGVTIAPDSIAPTVAKNQITKATLEYTAMLEKE